tara:strand:- start:17 stop:679 length:663 start_codon:yes stop_codon:yes gene_type:complete
VNAPPEGSFLYKVMVKTPTEHFVKPILPIYNIRDYLRLIEENSRYLGIPFVDPQLPVYVPHQPPPRTKEPVLDYLDKVYVNLKILKNGMIRIKIVPNFLILYEKYYKHAKRPPFKLTIQAYKAAGFSDTFLERINRSEERKLLFAQKVPTILEKIFDKEPVKKMKRAVKKKEIVVEEVPIDEPEPEVENEEDPVEDGAMDVEPDPEDEEVEEEEYITDED